MLIQGVTLTGTYVTDVPSLVTNGLTYYIDAGNSSSYSGTGSNIADLASSSLGNTTIFNSPTFTSASQGSYITTNGSTQYLLTPDLVTKFNSPSNEAYTLEAWIRTSSDNGVVITEQGALPVNSGWHVSAMEIVAGSLRVGHWNAGVVNLLVGAVTRNIWQQYVATYDGTTLRGYINSGTPTSLTTGRQSPWESGNNLWYGIALNDSTSLGDGSYLAADFGLFRLYNRALTAAEILQNYRATGWRYGL